MVKKILFVDDERQILRALKRLFMDGEYETFFVESGEEAIAYLENSPVDLVISDIRMPGMSGFELLKIVKAKYPSTIRVALSGYTDSRTIYRALEENVAKMYMFKPWDNNELRNIIDRMFELEDILQNKKILDLINNLDDLPTVPAIYTRIKEMISEDEDVEKIARLIESDQASSSKILRIANSAFYGAKTGSISQAIMYIGLMNVKNIVLSNSIFRVGGPGGKSIEYLWHNATLTNRYTSLIYQKFLGKKIPNIFASAGLLHNIGMVVLMAHYNNQYSGILQSSTDDSMSILQKEREQMGITHQELGGYLLNWWELPLPIIESALYHHMPMDERVINRELVCSVHLANANAWRQSGKEMMEASQEDACYAFLKLNRSEVEAYFTELGEQED